MKNLLLISGILILLVIGSTTGLSAQEAISHFKLDWKSIQVVEQQEGVPVQMPTFSGAIHRAQDHFLPLFHRQIPLPEPGTDAEALILNPIYESITETEADLLRKAGTLAENLQFVAETGIGRGMATLDLQLIPLVMDPNGSIRKLVAFDLLVNLIKPVQTVGLKQQEYSQHSVLSSGDWYKVKIRETGLYKITYQEIQAMGVNMATVIPSRIRLFGKPGGMLPESNAASRYDDLPENAILVVTANPGVFAPGDYILFYGTSPDAVVFNSTARKFEHRKNYYSDDTWYFLNFDGGEGKRIGNLAQSLLPPMHVCTTYTDFRFHNDDQYNLIKSGKQWVGEKLGFNNDMFNLSGFSFPDVETTRQAFLRYRVVARATTSSNFSITANSTSLSTKNLPGFTTDTFSQEVTETKAFSPVEGEQQVSFRYNPPNTSAQGYIDWIEMSIPRKMIFTGGTLQFADPVSVVQGNVTDFRLKTSNAGLTIWEVTNPVNVKKVETLYELDTLRFILPTDTLRRFLAWDNTSFNSVTFDGKVENQDLHGIEYTEMLIVTHPDFLAAAERLANHHRITEGMNVTVVTSQQVYNEFSSGSPDISAIRDFVRMLYTRPEAGKKLKYLLLFGDGSYDYKDHLPQNTNFVLAFQTWESQNLVFSTASDDFFGLLDEKEGNDAAGKIDIGIGRFPVDNAEQAQQMVDKCLSYMIDSPENHGDWRNSLCFIADDEDSNTHIRQVEDQVTPDIEKYHKVYNINKIYLDAYTQVTTPSGARYPEVNDRINEMVQKGVLIMNYTGHGGETGWATESILSLNDINSWTNYNHLPVFVTATCEFSRFDDPGRVSAGEQVFLNPAGGGVALLTTTRLANAGNNVELTMDLYDTLFSLANGGFPRFGDVIAFAKNQNSSTSLIRNFMLIGDPAMHLAYPKYNVVTTRINGEDISGKLDTISAMSEVEVEGRIVDKQGNLLTSFNGYVDMKVFDKYRWMMTRGNDPTSYKRYFEVQENILYQGTATVTGGEFTFSFIVPRDIDFSYGSGKISYYAYNDDTDACGYNDSIMIGGVSTNQITDQTGPGIQLFMNDERFVNGGTVSDSPRLLAILDDESGLNTVGNGIGHDLVATLDGDTYHSIVLNDYYVADLDSYTSGRVSYDLQRLEEGPHTLSFKAWDVFNNSSEATVEFTVRKNLALGVMSVSAYPNPFSEGIKVTFEHNLFNSELEVYLDIYSINGRLVNTLGPFTRYSEGYQVEPVEWDGLDRNNGPVNDGMYLIRVRASNGKSTAEKSVILVKHTR